MQLLILLLYHGQGRLHNFFFAVKREDWLHASRPVNKKCLLFLPQKTFEQVVLMDVFQGQPQVLLRVWFQGYKGLAFLFS